MYGVSIKSRTNLGLNRNTENILSISFRNKLPQKKKNNLFTLYNKIYILFACTIITLAAHASSVFPLSLSINLLTFYQNCVL